MNKLLLSVSLAFMVANAFAIDNHPVVSENIETLSSDSSKVQDLDEVIVISQPKESFRLRQQPISSTMFSALDIQNLDVHDLRELSVYVHHA